jgi:hypothetical protein
MKLSREHRRSHLKLEDHCIEIGGDSRVFRGLLAHFLGTTIGGKSCYVCHACNNPKCSNPNHLYWGSPIDNVIDQKESGTWKSGYQKLLDKYGLEKTQAFLRKGAISGGKLGGGSNALSEEDLKKWDSEIKKIDIEKYGWVSKLSKAMNCSHTHVRRTIKKYFPNVKIHRRKS